MAPFSFATGLNHNPLRPLNSFRVRLSEASVYRLLKAHELITSPAFVALDGPAIIEQMDSTTVVPPSARVEVERHGNLIITVSAASEGQ